MSTIIHGIEKETDSPYEEPIYGFLPYGFYGSTHIDVIEPKREPKQKGNKVPFGFARALVEDD